MLVEVQGRVTLDGEPPPDKGVISFQPYEPLADQPLRPSVAHFDKDGRFRASAFEGDYGLVPGKYRVAVECWEIPRTIDGPPPKSFIPLKYTNSGTSGFELIVAPDARSIQWNIDLESRPQ